MAAARVDPTVPILRTKLHRPPLPVDLVARDRLLERMDRTLEVPLTLVVAPAGYGKSLLVSQWIERHGHAIGWVSLDEGDSDLRVFLDYLTVAVDTLSPGACETTQALLAARELPPVPEVAVCLANELDALDRPTGVALDDYHQVDPGSPVHQLVGRLLEHPPRRFHLVLVTRRDPPLPLASLRAGARIAEVRLEDLRFTGPEAAELLTPVLGHSPSEDALAKLERQIEGWAAGLRLVSLAMLHSRNPDGVLKALHGGLPQTQEYLLSEVLSGLPPTVRQCLLRSSILDRFCRELVEAVRRDPVRRDDGPPPPELAGQQFIDLLLEENLFTIALDAHGEWYRYHHLFRDFLRRQLDRSANNEEIATLELRASLWLESEGLISESIDHALAAGDADGAADSVERHRYREMNADRWFVVAKWLESLPEEIKQGRPGLLLMQAWIAFWRFELAKIPPLLDQAAALLDQASAEPALLGELEFHQGNLAYWQGDCAGAVEPLGQALEKVRGIGGIVEGNVEIMLGLARAMSGHGEAAIEALNNRIRSLATEDVMLLTHLYAALAYVHIGSGQLGLARVAADRLQSLSKATPMHNTAAWAPYFLACTDLQSLELDRAKEGFSTSVQRPYVFEPRAAIDAFAGLAVTQQLGGESEGATQTVARLSSFARELNVPEYLSLAQSCRARIAVLQDDVGSVADAAESLGDESGLADLFTWLDVPAITHARVLIASGTKQSLTRATEMLRVIHEHATGWQLTCHSIDVLALRALALEQLGHAEESRGGSDHGRDAAAPGRPNRRGRFPGPRAGGVPGVADPGGAAGSRSGGARPARVRPGRRASGRRSARPRRPDPPRARRPRAPGAAPARQGDCRDPRRLAGDGEVPPQAPLPEAPGRQPPAGGGRGRGHGPPTPPFKRAREDRSRLSAAGSCSRFAQWPRTAPVPRSRSSRPSSTALPWLPTSCAGTRCWHGSTRAAICL